MDGFVVLEEEEEEEEGRDWEMEGGGEENCIVG